MRLTRNIIHTHFLYSAKLARLAVLCPMSPDDPQTERASDFSWRSFGNDVAATSRVVWVWRPKRVAVGLVLDSRLLRNSSVGRAESDAD